MNEVRRGTPGDAKRWAFLEGFDVGADGDPYLDRLRLVQTPWASLYLHHIHRPDLERDPHDHPWWFASLVIAGCYEELTWPDKTAAAPQTYRARPRWSVRCLSRAAAHRITSVDGSLWTLVLTGPRRGDWGFWRAGRCIPWREYREQA
jgi:hypothetical protein